eukprot:scaffold2106_cov198-Cylindrotheca_fusiformis.AAC.1
MPSSNNVSPNKKRSNLGSAQQSKKQAKRNKKGSLVGSKKEEFLCNKWKPQHYPQGMTATSQRARSVARQQQHVNGAPLANALVQPVAQTVTRPALLPAPPIHHPVAFRPRMNEMQLPVNNQYQWCQATEAAVQHPSLMFFYATIPSNHA